MLRLTSGDTFLDINPDLAGSIWRLTHKGVDVMRATPDGATDALDTACFPLVPFCNRIRNGEFTLEGHDIKLAPNLAGHPHALHGQGWRNPWKVIEATPSRAVLSFYHRPDDWPWEYEATQTFELRPEGLRIYLSVKNLSRGAMPAGLGFHPYFNRTPETRLKTLHTGIWAADADNLPTTWHAGVLVKDWSKADKVTHDVQIDHCYTGFPGKAEIFEGERLTHTMRASPDCHWMHLFVPMGETYFCVEPVNHMPDPFNQPNSGLKCLKSGETSMIWMDLAF